MGISRINAKLAASASTGVLRQFRSGQTRKIVLLIVGLLSLALVLLPVSSDASPSQTARQLSEPSATTTVQLASDAKPDGMVVYAGLIIRNIYNLDLATQSFMADGWYWLNWGDDLQAVLEKYKLEPTQLVEFNNEIEPGQYSVAEPLPQSAQVKADKPYSLFVKFSGKFYIPAVAQRLAPFDQQQLPIGIELKPAVLARAGSRVELVPLPIAKMPIAGEFADLSGFTLAKTHWSRQEVHYSTPAITQPGQKPPSDNFSRITANFTYGPHGMTVFLKWLLPLIVVMGIVILSPSIDGILGDVRLAIPSAALLTLVVLHDGYKTNFPPAPYLTYLDKLYTTSYIACFAIFLLFLVGTNAHSRAGDVERASITQQVTRLDLLIQVSTVVGFVVVAIIGWFH